MFRKILAIALIISFIFPLGELYAQGTGSVKKKELVLDLNKLKESINSVTPSDDVIAKDNSIEKSLSIYNMLSKDTDFNKIISEQLRAVSIKLGKDIDLKNGTNDIRLKKIQRLLAEYVKLRIQLINTHSNSMGLLVSYLHGILHKIRLLIDNKNINVPVYKDKLIVLAAQKAKLGPLDAYIALFNAQTTDPAQAFAWLYDNSVIEAQKINAMNYIRFKERYIYEDRNPNYLNKLSEELCSHEYRSSFTNSFTKGSNAICKNEVLSFSQRYLVKLKESNIERLNSNEVLKEYDDFKDAVNQLRAERNGFLINTKTGSDKTLNPGDYRSNADYKAALELYFGTSYGRKFLEEYYTALANLTETYQISRAVLTDDSFNGLRINFYEDPLSKAESMNWGDIGNQIRLASATSGGIAPMSSDLYTPLKAVELFGYIPERGENALLTANTTYILSMRAKYLEEIKIYAKELNSEWEKTKSYVMGSLPNAELSTKKIVELLISNPQAVYNTLYKADFSKVSQAMHHINKIDSTLRDVNIEKIRKEKFGKIITIVGLVAMGIMFVTMPFSAGFLVGAGSIAASAFGIVNVVAAIAMLPFIYSEFGKLRDIRAEIRRRIVVTGELDVEKLAKLSIEELNLTVSTWMTFATIPFDFLLVPQVFGAFKALNISKAARKAFLSFKDLRPFLTKELELSLGKRGLTELFAYASMDDTGRLLDNLTDPIFIEKVKGLNILDGNIDARKIEKILNINPSELSHVQTTSKNIIELDKTDFQKLISDRLLPNSRFQIAPNSQTKVITYNGGPNNMHIAIVEDVLGHGEKVVGNISYSFNMQTKNLHINMIETSKIGRNVSDELLSTVLETWTMGRIKKPVPKSISAHTAVKNSEVTKKLISSELKSRNITKYLFELPEELQNSIGEAVIKKLPLYKQAQQNGYSEVIIKNITDGGLIEFEIKMPDNLYQQVKDPHSTGSNPYLNQAYNPYLAPKTENTVKSKNIQKTTQTPKTDPVTIPSVKENNFTNLLSSQFKQMVEDDFRFIGPDHVKKSKTWAEQKLNDLNINTKNLEKSTFKSYINSRKTCGISEQFDVYRIAYKDIANITDVTKSEPFDHALTHPELFKFLQKLEQNNYSLIVDSSLLHTEIGAYHLHLTTRHVIAIRPETTFLSFLHEFKHFEWAIAMDDLRKIEPDNWKLGVLLTGSDSYRKLVNSEEVIKEFNNLARKHPILIDIRVTALKTGLVKVDQNKILSAINEILATNYEIEILIKNGYKDISNFSHITEYQWENILHEISQLPTSGSRAEQLDEIIKSGKFRELDIAMITDDMNYAKKRELLITIAEKQLNSIRSTNNLRKNSATIDYIDDAVSAKSSIEGRDVRKAMVINTITSNPNANKVSILYNETTSTYAILIMGNAIALPVYKIILDKNKKQIIIPEDINGMTVLIPY